MKPHMLITGIHRSGTTFVGKMLKNAPGVGYVQEPFNPNLGIRGIDRWYTYFHRGMPEEERAEALVRGLLRGKARYKSRPGAHGGLLRILGRKLFGSRDYLQYLASARLPFRERLLLKDPIAALSSLWLSERFGIRVIALIRHPAGFAASTARLGWDFDFRQLTSQKELMEDHLEVILEDADPAGMEHHERAALLWRCVYTVLADFESRGRDIRLIRLEDVSADPVGVFADIHDFLELEFTPGTRRLIQGSTSDSNPVDAANGRAHSLMRNSRALASSWKDHFPWEKLHRIMQLAGPLAEKYYPAG